VVLLPACLTSTRWGSQPHTTPQLRLKQRKPLPNLPREFAEFEKAAPWPIAQDVWVSSRTLFDSILAVTGLL
jgi:hypothetical protein